MIFPVIKAVSISVTAIWPLIDSVYISDSSEPTPPFAECSSEQLLQETMTGERLSWMTLLIEFYYNLSCGRLNRTTVCFEP